MNAPRPPRFELFRDGLGEYRWRLRAANRRVIADSGEGYKRKIDALAAAARLSEAAGGAETVDITDESDDEAGEGDVAVLIAMVMVLVATFLGLWWIAALWPAS